MREVFVVNPKKKKKAVAGRKKKRTVKRRGTKRATPRKRTTKSAAPRSRTAKRGVTMAGKRKRKATKRRKNPAPPPSRKRRRRNPTTAKRAARAVKRSFFGLDFRRALGDMPYIQAGMFAAKAGAKILDPDATETDPATWNWSSYFKGAIGGVVAGMVVNSFKRGKGQKVLEGALNLMAFKAIENELIAGSGGWIERNLGQEVEIDVLGQGDYTPDEYLMTGTDANPQAYDQNGNPYPADDRHRIPAGYMGAEALEPVTALGAEALEPITALGQDPWQKAYIAD
jgi:hypothetical protein